MEVSTRWAVQPATDGGPAAFLIINNDISIIKKSESELRTLSGSLMRAQDNEQRRIARELHDSTGQKLVALKMCINSAGKQSDLPPKARKSLSECLEFTDQIMQEVSTVAYLLHPPVLEDLGLASALRWLADGFSKRARVAVGFLPPRKSKRLPQNVEIALYRVAQEGLTNVVRHSGAKKVEVRLTQTPKVVTLEISDDGRGIERPPAKERQTSGVGLAGMKERLAQLGGTMEIESDGKGTTVRATVPLQAEATTTSSRKEQQGRDVAPAISNLKFEI